MCGRIQKLPTGDVDNFISSDVEVMDCDNGQSDKPEDWYIRRIWRKNWKM